MEIGSIEEKMEGQAVEIAAENTEDFPLDYPTWDLELPEDSHGVVWEDSCEANSVVSAARIFAARLPNTYKGGWDLVDLVSFITKENL